MSRRLSTSKGNDQDQDCEEEEKERGGGCAVVLSWAVCTTSSYNLPKKTAGKKIPGDCVTNDIYGEKCQQPSSSRPPPLSPGLGSKKKKKRERERRKGKKKPNGFQQPTSHFFLYEACDSSCMNLSKWFSHHWPLEVVK